MQKEEGMNRTQSTTRMPRQQSKKSLGQVSHLSTVTKKEYSPFSKYQIQNEREHSIHSMSSFTSKTPSRMTKYYSKTTSPIKYSNQTSYDEIERILRSENINLKQQNDMLSDEVTRMKQKNRKYKDACFSQKMQIQALLEQTDVHKQRADQMKEKVMVLLHNLEQKIMKSSDSHENSVNLQSLVEILMQSEIMSAQDSATK